MTANPKQFGRVGVIYGGTSSEREISVQTGAAIFDALNLLEIETVAIDLKENAVDAIANANLARSHIALHGPGA